MCNFVRDTLHLMANLLVLVFNLFIFIRLFKSVCLLLFNKEMYLHECSFFGLKVTFDKIYGVACDFMS
jgi:hypothetical protein